MPHGIPNIFEKNIIRFVCLFSRMLKILNVCWSLLGFGRLKSDTVGWVKAGSLSSGLLRLLMPVDPQLKTQNISVKKRGGRNVEFQNVDRPKISERRKCVLSWSERQNQNVKNVFWVDQNYDDQNVENRLLT